MTPGHLAFGYSSSLPQLVSGERGERSSATHTGEMT